MLKFLLGCAVTAVAFYVFANRPEWVHEIARFGREQVAVAAQNLSSRDKSTGDGRAGSETQPAEDITNEIDYARARRLVAEMNSLSWDELWHIMDEDDYDRRAAAAQVLLARAKIPASEEGVRLVQRRYIRSSQPESVKSGFSYLGLLALQPIPPQPVVSLAQGYVERHPQDPACDSALWALGELGSEEMVPYFFHVIEHEEEYGPAARERAFCCLVQCGRYAQARRRAMVPRFIRVYENASAGDTRSWALQALAHCAPDARARSVDEWRTWWSRQRNDTH